MIVTMHYLIPFAEIKHLQHKVLLFLILQRKVRFRRLSNLSQASAGIENSVRKFPFPKESGVELSLEGCGEPADGSWEGRPAGGGSSVSTHRGEQDSQGRL